VRAEASLVPPGPAENHSMGRASQDADVEIHNMYPEKVDGRTESFTKGGDEPHVSVEVQAEAATQHPPPPSYIDPNTGKMLTFRVWSVARPHMRAFHFGVYIDKNIYTYVLYFDIHQHNNVTWKPCSTAWISGFMCFFAWFSIAPLLASLKKPPCADLQVSACIPPSLNIGSQTHFPGVIRNGGCFAKETWTMQQAACVRVVSWSSAR
jgi:hypothetical protein